MFALQSLRALAVAMFVASSAPAGAAVPAPAHRRAVAANTQGWRYFKAGQLPRAAMRFRDALAIDPDYVLAHYNLACVSSRLREAAVALDELRWLAASSDPLAKAKLDKSLSDPDLDFVSVLPAVRELLQLPAAASPALAWLSERHGIWSAEQPTADCAERSYRFAFAADGTLQLTVREACAGEAVRTRVFDGTVAGDSEPPRPSPSPGGATKGEPPRPSPSPGGATKGEPPRPSPPPGGATKGELRVAVPSWAQWPDAVRLAFVACPGMGDAPASCFTLASDKSELGPFHRGLPGMSPMRARRDMATAR